MQYAGTSGIPDRADLRRGRPVPTVPGVTTTLPGSAPTASRAPSGPLGPDAPGYTAPAPGEDVPRETILPAFFGRFGGQEVPDFLLPALDELEEAFTRAVADPTFLAELDELRAT